MYPSCIFRLWYRVGDARTRFQFAELISRKSGWDATSLAGLAGGNLLRVMESAEQVAQQMQRGGVKSSWQLWQGRDDLPVWNDWPGIVGQDVQA